MSALESVRNRKSPHPMVMDNKKLPSKFFKFLWLNSDAGCQTPTVMEGKFSFTLIFIVLNTQLLRWRSSPNLLPFLLQNLPVIHPVVRKMYDPMRIFLYWPLIANDVYLTVTNCSSCIRNFEYPKHQGHI